MGESVKVTSHWNNPLKGISWYVHSRVILFQFQLLWSFQQKIPMEWSLCLKNLDPPLKKVIVSNRYFWRNNKWSCFLHFLLLRGMNGWTHMSFNPIDIIKGLSLLLLLAQMDQMQKKNFYFSNEWHEWNIFKWVKSRELLFSF